MKVRKLKRKHKKSYSLFSKDESPYTSLHKIFQAFDLEGITQELNLWKELAVCNDKSCYTDGKAREQLRHFCSSFAKLAEALYQLQQQNSQDLHNAHPEKTFSQTMPTITLIIHDQTARTENKPVLYLQQFFKNFSFTYSKAELLDLLEAVISYRGASAIDPTTIILHYRCFIAMLKLAKAFGKPFKTSD